MTSAPIASLFARGYLRAASWIVDGTCATCGAAETEPERPRVSGAGVPETVAAAAGFLSAAFLFFCAP